MPDSTANPIEVRSLEPKDIDEARNLFIAGFVAMRTELLGEDALRDFDGYLEQAVATDMADPYGHYVDNELKSDFWVAVASEQVVGTAAVYPIHNEPGVGEVFRVSVDERFRGLRIATILMDRVEEWSLQQGYVQLMLQTTDYLYAAHRLYEGRGYKKTHSFQLGALHAREYRKSLV